MEQEDEASEPYVDSLFFQCAYERTVTATHLVDHAGECSGLLAQSLLQYGAR